MFWPVVFWLFFNVWCLRDKLCFYVTVCKSTGTRPVFIYFVVPEDPSACVWCKNVSYVIYKKTQKGNVKLRFYLLPLFALCRRMEHSKISFERHILAKYPSNFKMGYMYVV